MKNKFGFAVLVAVSGLVSVACTADADSADEATMSSEDAVSQGGANIVTNRKAGECAVKLAEVNPFTPGPTMPGAVAPTSLKARLACEACLNPIYAGQLVKLEAPIASPTYHPSNVAAARQRLIAEAAMRCSASPSQVQWIPAPRPY